MVTVALAAGHVAGPGVAALAASAFVLLVAWCAGHRRVDRTLAGIGLYLGLLDGYVKLRTGSPMVTLARDVLVMAVAGGALLRATMGGQRLSVPPLGGLVLAFGAVVFVELFNPNGPGPVVGLAGVRQHLEFVPLFFLGYAFVRRETQLRQLLLILVVCAAAGGAVSYIQSTLTPAELADWGPGYSERIRGEGPFAGAPRVGYSEQGEKSVRPFGLGSDIGGGAVAAALALPALIALLLGASAKLRLALLLPMAGIGLAVATSGTRAGLVTVMASAVAFGLITAASKHVLRATAGLVLGAILVYGAFELLGSDNSSVERSRSVLAPSKALSDFTDERGTSVAKFDDYAVQYPLGLGVGSVGPAALAFQSEGARQAFNTETEWNFLVLEVGLVGLGIFIGLNVWLMLLALTRIRRLEDARMRLYLAALAAPLFGLIAAGFAGPTTASVPPAPFIWLVAGVLTYWLTTAYRRRAAGGSEAGALSRT